MRNGRQVRRVRLDEEPLLRDVSQERVVGPALERHDPAERHEPTDLERGVGEVERSGITVQHSADACLPRFGDHGRRVVLSLAGVHNHGPVGFGREGELRRERAALELARGVVVVIVEPTLADSGRAVGDQRSQRLRITLRVEVRCIVWVNACRKDDEARMRVRDPGREPCLLERGTDAHDAGGAGVAGAGDD